MPIYLFTEHRYDGPYGLRIEAGNENEAMAVARERYGDSGRVDYDGELIAEIPAHD